jgi:hypothetical protein
MERAPLGPSATKTERLMEAAIVAHAADPERAHTLSVAKTFKRSWIELAAALTRVRERETWRRWGFEDFDSYCHRELHLKRGTVDKLCASYGFLRANAPRLVRDDGDGAAERSRDRDAEPPPHEDADAPIPSFEAVQYVAKAQAHGAASQDTLDEMKRMAFDEGASLPALSRRFKEVAFPVDDEEMKRRLRAQIVATARRLADLVAEPAAGVNRSLAEKVEELAGTLAQKLEG